MLVADNVEPDKLCADRKRCGDNGIDLDSICSKCSGPWFLVQETCFSIGSKGWSFNLSVQNIDHLMIDYLVYGP